MNLGEFFDKKYSMYIKQLDKGRCNSNYPPTFLGLIQYAKSINNYNVPFLKRFVSLHSEVMTADHYYRCLMELKDHGKMTHKELMETIKKQLRTEIETYSKTATFAEMVELAFPEITGLPSMVDDKCNHDLKEYIGLTQRYNYCTKCDEKFY